MVAPLAGAWIETYQFRKKIPEAYVLPPSRGRGLKLEHMADCDVVVCELPPSRGRGLKLCRAHGTGQAFYVAPLAGAWIETVSQTAGQANWPALPPSRGRGLKLALIRLTLCYIMSCPPRGGVD